MFERYTERARRVLFFARYEVSHIGGRAIETEHLLLGLLREGKGLTSDLFTRAQLHLDSVRSEVAGRMAVGEKFPTTMEIPFSTDTKRILDSAASEAEHFAHNYIGTEHLLLAMLNEPETPAAQILVSHGINRDIVWQEIERLTKGPDKS